MSSDIGDPGIIVGIDGTPDSNAADAVGRPRGDDAQRGTDPLCTPQSRCLAGRRSLSDRGTPCRPGRQRLDENSRQVLADAVKIVEDMTGDHRPRINDETDLRSTCPRAHRVIHESRHGCGGSRSWSFGTRASGGVSAPGWSITPTARWAVIRNEASSPREGCRCLLVSMARRHRSWRPPSLSTKLPGGVRNWWPCTPGPMPRFPTSRAGESTGLTRTSWTRPAIRGRGTLAERLAGWRERYPDVIVHREVVVNRPAQHLGDTSRSARLVVVGSRGRGGFAGMLLGSSARQWCTRCAHL